MEHPSLPYIPCTQHPLRTTRCTYPFGLLWRTAPIPRQRRGALSMEEGTEIAIGRAGGS